MKNLNNEKGYRYGFNGKESDVDFGNGDGNVYDYGFRIYNAQIAKFLSVDPLTKSFPWNSTYAFAENDVIRCIDLDGLEKLKVGGTANFGYGKAGAKIKLLGEKVALGFDLGGHTNKIDFSFEIDFSQNVPLFNFSAKHVHSTREFGGYSATIGLGVEKEIVKNTTRELSTTKGAVKTIDDDFKKVTKSSFLNLKKEDSKEYSTIDINTGGQANAIIFNVGVDAVFQFDMNTTPPQPEEKVSQESSEEKVSQESSGAEGSESYKQSESEEMLGSAIIDIE